MGRGRVACVSRIGRTRVYLWQSHCRADTGEDAERVRRSGESDEVRRLFVTWGQFACASGGGSVCCRRACEEAGAPPGSALRLWTPGGATRFSDYSPHGAVRCRADLPDGRIQGEHDHGRADRRISARERGAGIAAVLTTQCLRPHRRPGRTSSACRFACSVCPRMERRISRSISWIPLASVEYKKKSTAIRDYGEPCGGEAGI